jgi:hypothetical protein
MRSEIVLKLNIINNKNSPKKKKKHQNTKSTYVVDREVTLVNWNRCKDARFKKVITSAFRFDFVKSWNIAPKLAYQ